MKQEEQQLLRDKEEFIRKKKDLEEEIARVNKASREVQQRSEDVEHLAKVTFKCLEIKRKKLT